MKKNVSDMILFTVNRIVSNKRREFVIYMAIIMLMWIPYLIAFFPGIYGYDAMTQVEQVFNNSYNTHHPLLHTLILGGLYYISKITDSDLGRTLYSVLQMLILSGFMAGAVCFIKREHKVLKVLVLCFYALLPLNGLMSIITTKDVMFAAFFLGAYINLCHMFDNGGYESKKKEIIYISVFVVTMLFRNNTLYGIILFSVILAVVKYKKYKNIIKTLVKSICIYMILAFCLKAGLNAGSSTTAEMWSVPLQQMARVAIESNDSELRSEIEQTIPNVDAYIPYLADPIKAQVYTASKEMLVTYVKCLVKHPYICIQAFFENIKGMWSLVSDPYAENNEFVIPLTYHHSPYGYIGFDGRDYNFMPWFRENLIQFLCYTGVYDYPLVSLPFRQATYFWVLVIAFIVMLFKKEYERNIPNLFLLCYCVTLMLAPCAATRYFYAIIICVPISIVRMLKKRNYCIKECSR